MNKFSQIVLLLATSIGTLYATDLNKNDEKTIDKIVYQVNNKISVDYEFDAFSTKEWLDPARQRRFIIQKSLEKIHNNPYISVSSSVDESFEELKSQLDKNTGETEMDIFDEAIKENCEKIIIGLDLEDRVRPGVSKAEEYENKNNRDISKQLPEEEFSEYSDILGNDSDNYNDYKENTNVTLNLDNSNDKYKEDDLNFEKSTNYNNIDGKLSDNFHNDFKTLNYSRDKADDESSNSSSEYDDEKNSLNYEHSYNKTGWLNDNSSKEDKHASSEDLEDQQMNIKSSNDSNTDYDTDNYISIDDYDNNNVLTNEKKQLQPKKIRNKRSMHRDPKGSDYEYSTNQGVDEVDTNSNLPEKGKLTTQKLRRATPITEPLKQHKNNSSFDESEYYNGDQDIGAVNIDKNKLQHANSVHESLEKQHSNQKNLSFDEKQYRPNVYDDINSLLKQINKDLDKKNGKYENDQDK